MAQTVYFYADDNVHNFDDDLWVSDGTTTTLIGGVANAGVNGDAATDGLQPEFLTVFGDEMIFAGSDSLDYAEDNGIWLTDGTANHTTEVGGTNPGSGNGASPFTGGNPDGLTPQNFTVFGDKAIFTGSDDSTPSPYSGLWVTDGTKGGTIELGGLGNKGILGSAPSVGDGFSTENFAAFNSSVVFDGYDSGNAMGLWISDGTTAGTVEIGGLDNKGIADAGSSFVANDFITLGDIELFNANSAGGNQSLWITDGTAAGTIEVGGFNNASIAGAKNTGLGAGLAQAVRLGDRVFFAGADTGGNIGLWTTDGTGAGTLEIGGIGDGFGNPNGVANVGPLGLAPTDLVSFGPFVLFNGIDKDSNEGLWLTGGTAGTTIELSGGLANEAADGLQPKDIVDLGKGIAVFIGYDDGGGGASGRESLWVTTGLPGGTQEIGGFENLGITGVDADGGLNLNGDANLVGGDGLAYFLGADSLGNQVLWETDGTKGGTKIVPGGTNSDLFEGGISAQNIALGPVPTKDDTFIDPTVAVDLSKVPGEDATLAPPEDTSTSYTVTGTNGTLTLLEATATIIGGGNLISLLYNGLNDDTTSKVIKPNVTLQNTNGNKDTVLTGDASHKGVIILDGNAQASVFGENDLISFAAHTTGNVVSIYETGGYADTVAGSNGGVNLYSANASVNGSNDTINLYGSGDTVTILGTTGSLDTINGSNSTIDINSGGGTYINGTGNTITEASGGKLSVATGKILNFTKTESISGVVTGPGELAITGGSTTIATGAGLGVAKLVTSGAKLSIGTLGYSGAFTMSGTLTLTGTLTLVGTDSLSGTVNGAGKLAIAGGATKINPGTTLSMSAWSISGAATTVTVGEAATYAGALTMSGGTLTLGGKVTLTGADTITGGKVVGANTMLTSGSAKTVSGFTVGTSATWQNSTTVNEAAASVTIGGATGASTLDNTLFGIYDLLGNVGILKGAGSTSTLTNEGVLEKTGGTGTSIIAPAVTNSDVIKVTKGILDFQGAVTGSGSDTILGAARLEFDSSVGAYQSVIFSGSGGTLDLGAPQGFAGTIKNFDLNGAASDAIIVLSGWSFTGATKGATSTSLGFVDGSTHVALTLQGDYTGHFHATAITGGTRITYTA